MGRPSAAYEPRRAADSVLYQVVRDHYETFAAQAASWRDGEGLPPFIDEEFRGFLRCGWVDHVFPPVPIRQWGLTVPHRLRYMVAWDHALCRGVVGVFMRAVLGFLRRRARADGIADGRSGAVAIIQRFGAALNVNVHMHALVLDGVFAEDATGALRFHPAPARTRTPSPTCSRRSCVASSGS